MFIVNKCILTVFIINLGASFGQTTTPFGGNNINNTSFGAKPTGTTFGTPAFGASTPAPAGGGLFGGQSTSTAGGGLFGQTQPQNPGFGQSSGGFGMY